MKFKEYLMEDVLDAIIDYRGKTPEKSDTGIPTLSAKSVKNNHINYAECYYISEAEYKRFMVRGFPQKGDILLTTEAPMGMVAKLDRADVAIAQRLLTLRGKEGVLDNDYLLYLLQSPYGEGLLKERETGTTVTGIKQAEFRRIIVKLPDITIQKKIGSILSAIDQKITCNTKINDNLQQQAYAYFLRLFVENADPSWRVGTIADLGTVVGGGTPSIAKPEYYTEDGIAWITPKDLSVDKSKFIAHGENDISELGFQNSSTTMMPAGTVLFSSRAPIGYIAIASNEVTTNQGFKSVVPHPEIGTPFIYYFLIHNLPLVESKASGSTFKEVSASVMKSVEAVIPDGDSIVKFNDFCRPVFEMQEKLEQENRKLAAMRDSLLPRLMSGEIDVAGIDI